MAVLFLNKFFDIFHAAHNYIEKLNEEREIEGNTVRILSNQKL
ncbi:TPA: hypothetical protein ACGW3F_003369 [Bacillus paranthracis]